MRLNISRNGQRNLARGAAVLLIGGLSAGCSSGISRFSSVDNVFTSTTNQQQIIPPANQPYPSQTASASQTAAPMTAQAGTVGRSALAPVAGPQTASAAPAVAPAASESAHVLVAPKTTHQLAAAEPAPDKTLTSAVKPTVPDETKANPHGATRITAKEGETLYNLSRRYGVSAEALREANGLSESAGLRVGQTVIIPATSGKAGGEAKVAAATAEHGTTGPTGKTPQPAPTGEKLAVLPEQPKVKQGDKEPVAEAKAVEKTSPASGSYTVAQGDTLSRIAKKTGVSVTALKKANNLEDGVLHIGQTLALSGNGPTTATASAAAPGKVDQLTTSATGPAAKGGAVASADPVTTYTPPKKADKVIDDAEKDTAAAPDATGIGRMRWPVRGRVISSYGSGNGKDSDGIDIAVPEGTPVKAAENGVVIYAGDGLKEFGNTVLVRHENGLVTVYGHASALKVTRGEKVKRGQEIAVSGMSGTTDTPKLHFEVRKNSTPVDPSTFLE